MKPATLFRRLLPILALALAACRPGQAVSSTPALAADEAALAGHIKLLADSDPKAREQAAASIRALVARYPSGTVNLSEPDGGEIRWNARLAQLRVGMSKRDALDFLKPAEVSAGPTLGGNQGYGQSSRMAFAGTTFPCSSITATAGFPYGRSTSKSLESA